MQIGLRKREQFFEDEGITITIMQPMSNVYLLSVVKDSEIVL